VALAALAFGALRPSPAPEPLLRVSIVPPPGTRFLARDITGTPHFALSPDGRAIVFVAAAPGDTPRLWVRPLHLTDARPLAGTEDASGPFWSPDSTQVAFFARRRLKKVSIVGGNVQDLAEISFDVAGGTWSRSGTILFAGPTADGLYRVPASGGTMERATTLGQGDSGHRWPQFLPDDRSYLFYIRSRRPNGSGVYVMPPGASSPRQLFESRTSAVYVDPGYLLFERNGALMAQRFDSARLELVGDAFALDDRVIGQIGPSHLALTASTEGALAYWTGKGGLSQIEWRDRQGTLLSRVGHPDRYFGLELSPDSTRLLALRRPEPSSNELVSIDLSSGLASPLTFSPIVRFGVWGGDGEHVLYGTVEPTGPRLVQQPAAGGRESLVVEMTNHWAAFPTDVSRDNRWLVCEVTAPTAWDLWSVDLGDGTRRAVVQTSSNEVMGQLSRDARWLAYVSDRSGRWEVYVTAFSERESGVWQISTGGGSQPRWRADGKELYFVAPDGAIHAVPVQTAPTFKAEVPRRLFTANLQYMLTPFKSGYDVAADGGRFIVGTLVEQDTEPITFVHNWTATLAGR
jgi:Tol biopolymer transport system component